MTGTTQISIRSEDIVGGAATYGSFHYKKTIKSDRNLIEDVQVYQSQNPDLPFGGWLTLLLDGKPSKAYAQLTWINPEDRPDISGVYEYNLML
jgi:hypothetical protein